MPVFLFTDIENSTQLWEKHSQAMGPALARHDAILQELVGRYDGRILRHRGDGISAIFEGGAPLDCAIAVQKQFASEDWGEVRALRLRLALHAGEAERREFTSATIGQKEEYFGPVLNRTARILDAGWGGLILLTPEVLTTCSLPDRADLQDLGVHLLKNLEIPQQIYGLLHPDLDEQTFPPLRSLGPAVPPCPYRGLFAFREEDVPFFFGREMFIERLVEAVHQRAMVAVIGPSGSGKSSVVFAGLLPRLRQGTTVDRRPSTADSLLDPRPGETNLGETQGNWGELKDAKGNSSSLIPHPAQPKPWLIANFRPGSRPFHALAGALTPLLEPGLSETKTLIETRRLAEALNQKDLYLYDVVERIQEKNPEANRFLLVANQFEELYTLCQDTEMRHHFLDVLFEGLSLAHLPPNPPVSLGLVLTLRADFMGQALVYRPFADILQDADLKLGPMTRQELSRAIINPAEKLQISFEMGLIDRILDDVGNEPGNLPLLEFALTLLWERQVSGQLTHVAYEAIGRVAGALASYADEVYTELSQSEQEQARQLFVQLVRPGEGTEDTRRLATRAELGEANWPLVQRLADARLVVVGRDPAGQETVEVVHEALIRGWVRLRAWMGIDRAFRVWQEQLRVVLRQWEVSGRDEGGLLRGVLLVEAEEWAKTRSADLSPLEHEFLEASVRLRDRRVQEAEVRRQHELVQAQALAEAERQRAEEQVRASRRLRWLAGGLAVVFLLAVAAAALAISQRQEAQHQALAAETERNRAEAQAQQALSLQLAAQATNQIADRLDLALLLSLEANRVSDTPEGKGSLLDVLASGSRLTTIWRNHTNAVWSVAFSPECASPPKGCGRLLASASADNTIMLWDVAAGQPLGSPLTGHTASVNSVAFSPDGKLLASASDDETIILWDVATRQPIGPPLTGHTNWITIVGFSPDGQTLASASYDKSIILWDVTARKAIGLRSRLTGHGDWVADLAFSPDSKTLASASFDQTIMLWDVATGQALGPPLTGHKEAVSGVAFKPGDGHILASASADQTIILWDVTTRQPLGEPFIGHTDAVESLAFSPDGQLLASGSTDQTIILWDVSTGKAKEPPLLGHTNAVVNVSFSPDGRTLASASRDRTIILWDIASQQRLGERLADQEAPIWDVAFDPAGRLLASASDDGSITLWHMDTRQADDSPLTGHTDAVSSVTLSPDGQTLASASYDKHIILWNVSTHQPLGPHSRLTGHTAPVTDLAFSLDGQTLASASQDKTIILWDVATGQALGPPLTNHTDRVARVAFNPAGQTWASGSYDRTILLWDAAANRPLGSPLSNQTDRVWSMAFSPEGQLLATGSWSQITLWNLNGPEPDPQMLVAHTGWVNDVAFSLSDGGQLLASAGEDGTLVLWDVATRQPLGQITTGHTAEVLSLAFNPAQPMLVSSGADGAIILWDVDLTSWQNRACRIANRNLTQAEWRQYFGDAPYRMTCPDVPPPKK